MTSPAIAERRVALAAVAGAHGISGELRLKLFSDSAASLAAHSTLYLAGAERRLIFAKDAGKSAIARFAGVTDRAGAEALRGSLIEIDRAALPKLGDGEYYHADLIGLPCFDQAGTPLGAVAAVENYGAGDLLDIERPDGKRTLIPFKAGIADLEDDRLILDADFLA